MELSRENIGGIYRTTFCVFNMHVLATLEYIDVQLFIKKGNAVTDTIKILLYRVILSEM